MNFSTLHHPPAAVLSPTHSYLDKYLAQPMYHLPPEPTHNTRSQCTKASQQQTTKSMKQTAWFMNAQHLSSLRVILRKTTMMIPCSDELSNEIHAVSVKIFGKCHNRNGLLAVQSQWCSAVKQETYCSSH